MRRGMNTCFLEDRNLKLIHCVKELIYADKRELSSIRMTGTGRRIWNPEELNDFLTEQGEKHASCH